MADAVGAAAVQGLVDRFGAKALAGVNRHILVVVHHVIEGIQVVLGRMVFFGTGEVKGHHAALAPSHRQAGQVQRTGRVDGADTRDNDAAMDARFARRSFEPCQYRGHRAVRRQALVGVLQRTEAHFEPPHAVGRKIHGQFVGHAGQIRFGLQHLDRVIKMAQEVVNHAGPVRGEIFGPHRVRVLGHVHTRFTTQFHEGFQTQRAVQVHVQVRLGQRPQQFRGYGRSTQEIAGPIVAGFQGILRAAIQPPWRSCFSRWYSRIISSSST